jgi:hypothetical protein
MSKIVPIEPLPNQSLSFQVDDVRYDLTLRSTVSMMAVDIAINDELVLQGWRVCGGTPLIPFQYLEGVGGNFIFLTELGDLVTWEKFGVTQILIYVTSDELEEIRAN